MDRITREAPGCFQYSLKDHEPVTGEFANYDTFFNYMMAIKRLGELEDANEPAPAKEWHEDDGDVIWWRLPIEEPPYIGTPLCSNFKDNYYTHFTRIVIPLGITR